MKSIIRSKSWRVIACGYVLLSLGINGSLVVEACSDTTVRANSPCVTTFQQCRFVGSVCSTNGDNVFNGDFQCDQPNGGTTCMGSGTVAPCYDQCHCLQVMATCAVTTPCTAYTAETKQEVSCAAG